MPGTNSRGKYSSSRVSDVDSDRRTIEDRLDEMNEKLSSIVTQEFLNKFMDSKLKQLKQEIRKENGELIDRLEGRIFDLEQENELLRNKLSHQEKQIGDLFDCQSVLESRNNDLEQNGRKNSIRIFGISDTAESETAQECIHKVTNFVRTNLKVPLEESDIDIAHRLGRFQKNKARSVIVKFTHRVKKQQIVTARRILKGSQYRVSEDLTKSNQEKLRNAFKLECVKSSFSVDGKLYAVLQNGKKRRLGLHTPLTEDYLMNEVNFR